MNTIHRVGGGVGLEERPGSPSLPRGEEKKGGVSGGDLSGVVGVGRSEGLPDGTPRWNPGPEGARAELATGRGGPKAGVYVRTGGMGRTRSRRQNRRSELTTMTTA